MEDQQDDQEEVHETAMKYSMVCIAFRLSILYNKYYSAVYDSFFKFASAVHVSPKNEAVFTGVVLPLCKYLFETQTSRTTGIRVAVVKYLRFPDASLFPMTVAMPALVSRDGMRALIYLEDEMPFAILKALEFAYSIKVTTSERISAVDGDTAKDKERVVMDPDFYVHLPTDDRVVRYLNHGASYRDYANMAPFVYWTCINLKRCMYLVQFSRLSHSIEDREVFIHLHAIERCLYELPLYKTCELLYEADAVPLLAFGKRDSAVEKLLQPLLVMSRIDEGGETVTPNQVNQMTIDFIDSTLVRYLAGWKALSDSYPVFDEFEQKYVATGVHNHYSVLCANVNPPLASKDSSPPRQLYEMAGGSSSMDTLVEEAIKIQEGRRRRNHKVLRAGDFPRMLLSNQREEMVLESK